jgi:hypothetical protein
MSAEETYYDSRAEGPVYCATCNHSGPITCDGCGGRGGSKGWKPCRQCGSVKVQPSPIIDAIQSYDGSGTVPTIDTGLLIEPCEPGSYSIDVATMTAAEILGQDATAKETQQK